MIPLVSKLKDREIYEAIELTGDELAEAVRAAKEKKYYRLLEEEKLAREAEGRRMLTERWSYDKTRSWIEKRIGQLYPGEDVEFQDIISDDGRLICNAGSLFTLLCYYFSGDASFVLLAQKMGFIRPDLRKGLLLVGRIGCGKTSLMRIFQRNQRQGFMVLGAKEIAWNWRQADKEAGQYLQRLSTLHQLPINDSQNFYQRVAGLCIDDVGTEDIQNSFSNKSNVIADLIEGRYYNRCAGPYLHLTTNLIMSDIKEFYGDRVASRLRETMNVIEYKGEDRRK